MNGSTMGKKIREARLAKKMTQSEVVGNFITRNMLSQIESGNAMPSMKTLEYLSGVLDISVSELVSDSPVDNTEKLLSAKKAFKDERYDEVISIIGEVSNSDTFYDEYCAILSKTYKRKAELTNDVTFELMSKQYASLGIYSNI